jgi:DNA-binding transcriptional LysR family regulator
MRLNMHLLRVFHAAVQEGSFSGAARSLHISQPAVSKAVSELERQLDMALVERGGRKPSQGLTLTDAGRALHAHARAIFALERAAVTELQQRSGLKRGQLVIGASTTVASYWLPRWLQSYTTAWPDIVLRVVVANTQSIVEELFDCRLDLALVEGPVQREGIASLPWRHERLVIVGPPGFGQLREDTALETPGERPAHPTARMSAAELTTCTWLLRETGSGTREVTLGLLARHGLQIRRSIEIGSNEGMARAVAAGLGVAVLPHVVVEDLLMLGRVVELQVDGLTGLSRPLYRLERLDRPPSPPAEVFRQLLAGEPGPAE